MTALAGMDMGTLYAYVISENAVRETRRLLAEANAPGGATSLSQLVAGKAKTRSILELEGLGKEIWEGVDPKEYVRKLRDEWNNR
jgi:hypothetical protein